MQEKQEDNEGSKLRLEGNKSFKNGDYKGALALYTRSLEKQKTVDAFNNRAQAYILLKRYEEAIVDCDSALKMENDNFKAHGRKGIALHALGRFEMALKELFWSLELQPADKRFQQLHHECEKALDAKNFVNMKLIISSYPGTDVKLYLVDGLPYRHMHQHPTFFFNNLNSLLLHLNEYVSASLGSIQLTDVTVDGRLMQFFRSLRPATLRGPNIEYFNVNSSKADFDELFGGKMFAPMGLWFYQDDDAPFENHFFSALKSNKLPAIKGVKSLCVSLTEPEMSKVAVPFTGSQLDIDSCIDFLHTEYPGIPAHVRRSSAFYQHVQDTNTDNRDMDVCEGVDMLRSYSGRMIMLDLRYIGFGKLFEVIDKCKERFLAANHQISYSLHVRFVLVMNQMDPMDKQALMPLFLHFEQNSQLVMKNRLGEQLRLFLVPLDTPDSAHSKEKQSIVAKIFGLHIERVFS